MKEPISGFRASRTSRYNVSIIFNSDRPRRDLDDRAVTTMTAANVDKRTIKHLQRIEPQLPQIAEESNAVRSMIVR